MNWFKLFLLPANFTFPPEGQSRAGCTHILPFLTTVALLPARSIQAGAAKKWLHLGTKAEIFGSKQKV